MPMLLSTDKERLEHLLRRAGLGASQRELKQYEKLGWRGTVDALLDFESVPEDYTGLAESLLDKKGQLRPQMAQVWWIYRLLTTKRPLQERMTLFWHNHFATSASKVNAGWVMLQQNELFRRMALGSFRDLLVAVSKDPAMILWLDNNTNVKGKPNENYAREVMELFTLGIGNYTEKDVQEAARAFTGWNLQRNAKGIKNKGAKFLFRPALHDNGIKTVLGQTGNFNGEDIVDILVKHPATAKRLCKKLWEYFAYPDPEPAVIDALVKTYYDSNYSMKALVQRILTAESFYKDKAYRAIYKSPLDFTIATLRALEMDEKLPVLVPPKPPLASDGSQPMLDLDQLPSYEDGTPVQKRSLVVVRAVAQSMKRMGMDLLYPPSVEGWHWGKEWVNSATMLERMKLSDFLFNTANYEIQPNPNKETTVTLGGKKPARARSLFGPQDVLSETPVEQPLDFVHRFLGLLDADLPETKRREMASVIEKAGGLGVLKQPKKSNELMAQLARITFASPEYQFC